MSDELDYDTPLDTRRNELALEGWGILYYATITNSQTKKFIDRILQNEMAIGAARKLATKWHRDYQGYQKGDFTAVDAVDDAAYELEDALNGEAS